MSRVRKYSRVTIFIFMFLFLSNTVSSENLSNKMYKMEENYLSKESAELDENNDGIVDIYDMVKVSKQMSKIDITRIKNNYFPIIAQEDKLHFEELGYTFISENCFIVAEEAIDLFAYVSGAEGMEIEILEGNNNLIVENDYIYLNDITITGIARVRLKNEYAVSEEFYIYSTQNKELHDYTYDNLLKLLDEQSENE